MNKNNLFRKGLVFVIIVLLIGVTVLVLPVSSEITKNDQNSPTKSNITINFNKEDQDFQKHYYPKFPVMNISTKDFESDETTVKPIPKSIPNEFSWTSFNGKDWTTPARNQGNCGSCWAFATLGLFESIIEIKENCAGLNPDLSEQYILSCLRKAGSCDGGNIGDTLKYIMKNTSSGNYHNGVIPENCFNYYADDKIPCSYKCKNWEELLVPLFNYSSWKSDGSNIDRERIKTDIMEKGPVATIMSATDDFGIWGAYHHNPSDYFYHLLPVPISSTNHFIVIVGWKDSSSVRNGGYWICKNSWGSYWGYDGFFNLAYGCLNCEWGDIYSVDYDPDSYDWPPYADPGGPYGGYPNQEVTFNGSRSIGFEGSIVDYSWDFGDGNTGSGETTNHIYQNLGKYTIILTVTDSKGNNANKTTNLWIQETNSKPAKPTINGPSSGKVGKKYEYSFSSTDPDDNDVLYFIDWGDGKCEEWIGPYASGEEFVLAHIWTENTNSEIKVKVKDPYGEESEWETLKINMPKTNNFNFKFDLLSRFFERFSNAFPLLKYLLLKKGGIC